MPLVIVLCYMQTRNAGMGVEMTISSSAGLLSIMQKGAEKKGVNIRYLGEIQVIAHHQ